MSVLDSTHEAMSGFMRLTISLTRSGSARRAQKVLEEHTAIVEAIRARDGDRARVRRQPTTLGTLIARAMRSPSSLVAEPERLMLFVVLTAMAWPPPLALLMGSTRPLVHGVNRSRPCSPTM